MAGSITLLQFLQELFFQTAQEAFQGVEISKSQIEVTQSTDLKFGHYQCNSAMKLTSLLKRKPREIAEILVEQCRKHPEAHALSKMDIAGPGFINVEFESNFLATRALELLQELSAGKLKVFQAMFQRK